MFLSGIASGPAPPGWRKRVCIGGQMLIAEKASKALPAETLTIEQIDRWVSHAGDASFDVSWANSPPTPVVIRQNHPNGPAYQEGQEIVFQIPSMKRPRMVRLESGRLVMVATAWLHETLIETPICLHSDDDGHTWVDVREIPWHGTLVNLGNNHLMTINEGKISDSLDGGRTWRSPRELPLTSYGHAPIHHGSVLAEGDDVYALFFHEGPARGPVGWTGHTALWRSRDRGRTWESPVDLPHEWDTSEGSIARAADGALVASLRTAQAEGLPSYCDHWRRITVARSTDDGKTWCDRQVYFRYGKVHSELLRLPDGRILMTYAVRMGELDGQLYHGIEAVISRDHGQSWDWDNRFILFRWSMHQTTHSPISVHLGGGRILTTFLYGFNNTWGNRNTVPANIGFVSGIFWSVP